MWNKNKTNAEKVLRIGVGSDCVKPSEQSGFEIVKQAYLKSDIERLIIEDGITEIGIDAFRQCSPRSNIDQNQQKEYHQCLK